MSNITPCLDLKIEVMKEINAKMHGPKFTG